MFTVNPSTYVITIPKTYLTLVSGTLYRLNTDTFRLDLKAWEESIEGIVQPKTHIHNTEVTVAGTTFARTVEMIAPYSITFEDDQYTVLLEGSNNNIFDVTNGILNQNQVQVVPGNSAGLIVRTVGSAVTEQDKLDIATQVWAKVILNAVDASTVMEEVYKIQGLCLNAPMTVTPTSRVVDGVTLKIEGDAEMMTRVTRE